MLKILIFLFFKYVVLLNAKCLTSSEATNDTLLTTIIPATTEDSFKRVKTEIRPTRRTSITTTEENFN